MGMFCNQCQETARNKGCEFGGICGKSEELADLQDLLIYTLKGISEIVIKGKLEVNQLGDINHEIITSLFMTITNANFDDEIILNKIKQMISFRNMLRQSVMQEELHDAATFEINTMRDLIFKASYVGMLPKDEEDIRSLKQLVIFGIKGLAAYTYHAHNPEKGLEEIYSFIYEALAATLKLYCSMEELVALTMKTGEFGVKAMALLDEANTSKFGNPEITAVNIGVRNNPGILVSGHDLNDLHMLLEQTKGTGVDVYTHSEMLPAHYYPAFKRFENFAGNYGNAWWKQEEEFLSFNGPILFTTNCIVPPSDESVKYRIFTTGASGYPGCVHIEANTDGKKDFTKIIELAKTLKAPVEIESGRIIGGFAHGQVFALAGKLTAAVKSGAIRKFFVMAGCDGRMESREYYTQFAKKLPKDTVILTAGCAKYRYNKLDLGCIGEQWSDSGTTSLGCIGEQWSDSGTTSLGGIPRVLDAGQCNDSYSLVMIALKLKEAFGLNDINELPIVYNIAWYEQKAVLVLLALLYLGVKNIHLGPTLPAFLSPNISKILIDNFGIKGIGNVDEDIKMFMGE